MALDRRKLLMLVGGGTVVAASAGLGSFVTTRTPHSALAPWSSAGNYKDPRKRALSYALLAPNPHNRQPWVAELVADTGVVLYRDPSRDLPETDPFDRQLTIGMGCFIELFVQAAAEERLGVDLELFPDGEDAKLPVASLNIRGSASPDPLFQQVLNRRTNRDPYDLEKSVSADDIKVITQTSPASVRSAGTSDPVPVETIRDLALEAMILETEIPRTHRESIELMRIGRAEIEANPDGISLGGPMLDALGLLGIITREKAADPKSEAFASTLDLFRNSFGATPAFVWLATKENTRHEQIAAGRAWVRGHLAATTLGLAMQPVSQSLQEYPEMRPHYLRIHDMLSEGDETIQMLGRLGYGTLKNPAPRWPLESFLRVS